MKTKTINRNIPVERENRGDKFRVKYNDKNDFQVLKVNITRIASGELLSYQFDSDNLPDKDSIYFSTSVINNKMNVRWIGLEPKTNLNQLKTSTQKLQKVIKPKSISEPIVGRDCKVLILGTMPGEQSLTKQEYYAHPRNLFWKLIANLTNNSAPLAYAPKKQLAIKSQIAIWDVCELCIREGSLDTAIKDEFPNDFETFFKKYPTLKTIAFNGNKAAALFYKYFDKNDSFQYLILPSSSPANTGLKFEDKLKSWSELKTFTN